MKVWRTSRREIDCSEKTLVMAILNVTPDSFSDGGESFYAADALRKAEKLIEDGADILDIGGESTRPASARVSEEEEIKRVVPVIEAISKRFDIPISVDTSKANVAERAVLAGAEIINDVSGLRFDRKIAEIAAREKTGLILMHLRGRFETMHRQEPVKRLFNAVVSGLRYSTSTAVGFGVKYESIAVDIGIGFGKSFEQNLELIANLDKYCSELKRFPMLVGVSRKSFIGKILGDVSADKRLYGTLAANAVAVWNGANIVRVHDVRETIETLKVIDYLKKHL